LDAPDLNPRSAQRAPAEEPDDEGRKLVWGILLCLPVSAMLWVLIIWVFLALI
jgi:hypothetical protein